MKSYGGTLCSVAVVVILGFSCGVSPERGLSGSDLEEIRSLEEDYTGHWLAGDTAAVMSLLAEDAIIMPSGIRPIAGADEIRRFWWPQDGSVTTIQVYETDIEEITGESRLAYVRGTGHLEFTYAKGGEKSEHSSDNMFLMIVRKDSDGRWKIWRRMWGGYSRG